jgi:hypothetical protein
VKPKVSKLRALNILRAAAISMVLLAAMLLGSLPPMAHAAPATTDPGWATDSSYSISFLGRDGNGGSDRYRVTLSWGASFFAVGAESMPLVPAEHAVNLVMDGYRTAFPGRPLEDIQPGDSFDFTVPTGTLVCTQWQQKGSTIEYKSLRGDRLTMHSDPQSPLLYLLLRAEAPNSAEAKVNQNSDLKPAPLAQALYGNGDPGFKPDFLQLTRAQTIITRGTETVTVDLSQNHLDDLQSLRAGAQSGGKTEDGMDVYLFRSDQQAQPLFRIEDAIGDRTDPTGLPATIRVYYYKDGEVRTYQMASDTVFLSDRQPKNDVWSKVFADYGKLDPSPTRWDIGQPENDAQAQELNKVGIVVLRYQPKEAPPGNFFTHILDQVFAMMKRKSN